MKLLQSSKNYPAWAQLPNVSDSRSGDVPSQPEDRFTLSESLGQLGWPSQMKLPSPWKRVLIGSLGGAVMARVGVGMNGMIGGESLLKSTLVGAGLLGFGGAMLGANGGCLGVDGDLCTYPEPITVDQRMDVQIGSRAAAYGAVHGLLTCVLGQAMGGSVLAHVASGAVIGGLEALLIPSQPAIVK